MFKTPNILLTVPRWRFFCGTLILFVLNVCNAVLSVPSSPVVTCWERADLLALVFDVFLCFCHFLIWCPGSGVVFDCSDS